MHGLVNRAKGSLAQLDQGAILVLADADAGRIDRPLRGHAAVGRAVGQQLAPVQRSPGPKHETPRLTATMISCHLQGEVWPSCCTMSRLADDAQISGLLMFMV